MVRTNSGRQWGCFGILLTFFAVFVLYPLIYVVRGAIIINGDFSLEFLALTLTDRVKIALILNSVNLAAMVTLLTAAVSIPLSIAMVRYSFYGKSFFRVLILVPLVLPPFVGALGIKHILGRFGVLNMVLLNAGIVQAPIDWLGRGGFVGVVLLETLHLFPIMYLSVSAAFANVDVSLEQAAQSVGASGLTLWRRILLPLINPGIFASASVVFVWSFTDLGAPLVFEYRNVVPVQIFNMLSDIHSNPAGYSLILVMIAVSLIFFALSKHFLPRANVATLASLRIVSTQKPAKGVIKAAIYLGLGTLITLSILPHLGIVLVSLSERWYMSSTPEIWTFGHYEKVFSHHLTASSLRNSLLLAGASAFLDVVLGVTIAYLLSRAKIPIKGVLDTLTMIPLAVPGIIIAFGYLSSFSGTLIDPRVNPIPLLIIGYAARRLPYMVRAVYAGLAQVSVTLEEAAASVGAAPLQTLRRITLPLVLPSIIGGAILCCSFAMLEVSDSLILALEEPYYPITKAIYVLLARPDGPLVASALGVVGMLVLCAGILCASRILGRNLEGIFRA